MTWSPFFTDVTPGPMSTTMPAPSWPRIAGNKPSGSPPERVNSSVWQMPVAFSSTSTSPALGPSRSTISICRGLPASKATAALTRIAQLLQHLLRRDRIVAEANADGVVDGVGDGGPDGDDRILAHPLGAKRSARIRRGLQHHRLDGRHVHRERHLVVD